ncbi:transposase family protein [Micromonospora sp. NPDC049460]|uniref:transposase family protein n=1 Tax=Micromonospora sp. NPDC049460 TaxID=3364272 RepID=UPI00379C1E95
MIAYPAMVDVPRELVRHLARLLATERRARGTRRGTRALTCFYQALLVLVWFRKAEDKTLLGAGFGVSRATAYRYVSEGVAVLAAQAPDLHEALQRVADDGWSYVILDGKLFDCDRVAETTLSVKGDTIDAWYSGKHRDFGANIQAIIRPDGLPIWTSDAMPGHLHDLTCAQLQGITAALNWAAAELDLPALADAGYDGAGHGIKTPVKQPTNGRRLSVGNRTTNRLLRGLRWQGERGFAILHGRWKALHHTTSSPRGIGDIVAAALHLTHFEYRYPPASR